MISLGLTEAMREAVLEELARDKNRAGLDEQQRQYAAFFTQQQQNLNAQAYAQETQMNAAENAFRTGRRRPSTWNVTYEQQWSQQIPHPMFVPPPVLPEWARVLGVTQSATRHEIESAYRRLVKTAHPDAGGTQEAMVTLNRAIAAARLAVPS